MRAAEALAHAVEVLEAAPDGSGGFRYVEGGVCCTLRLEEDEGVSWFELTVPRDGLGRVDLEPETGFDRLGKRLGVCRELQVGDEAFDAAVYIDTVEADDVVRAYLATPEARAAVLEVVAGGDPLELSRSGVRTRLAGSSGPARIVAAARALIGFVRALPLTLPRPATGAPARRWFLSVSALFTLPWIGYGLTSPVAPRALLLPWVAGVGLSLLVTLLLLPVVALFVRKRSAGFQLLVVTGCFLAFGLLPAGPAALFLVNASLDVSPVEQPARVASATCAEGDHGPWTDVTVHLAGGSAGEPEVATFGLPGCRALPRGAVVSLRTSPGGLGFARWHGLALP